MSASTSASDAPAARAASGAPRLRAAVVTRYLSGRRTHLIDALRGAPGSARAVVLLRAAPVWDGPAEPAWEPGYSARVVAAPSPLAVHELILDHLAGRVPGPAVLVVLTDREEHEFDPAILARVHGARIRTVQRWQVIKEAFGARDVDGRLRDHAWAAAKVIHEVLDATRFSR